MLAHALCALVLAHAPVSGAENIPDRQPIIAKLVDELTRAGHRRTPPGVARGLVAELHSRFWTSGPKDQRTIAGGVASFLQASDLGGPAGVDRPLEMRREAALHAANALSLMGDEGVVALLGLLGGEPREGDPLLERGLVLALGRTQSSLAIPRLLALLQHPESIVRAAAAEALGEFGKLEGERRKDVFYALLQTLLDAREKTERDPFDAVARRPYDALVAPIITSLQRLSGHDERDPSLWLTFWNKHKRDDWDELTS